MLASTEPCCLRFLQSHKLGYISYVASQLVIYKHEAPKFERSFTKEVHLLLFSYHSTYLKLPAEGSTWCFLRFGSCERQLKSKCISSMLNSL